MLLLNEKFESMRTGSKKFEARKLGASGKLASLENCVLCLSCSSASTNSGLLSNACFTKYSRLHTNGSAPLSLTTRLSKSAAIRTALRTAAACPLLAGPSLA